jgi:hypothetical protein
VFLQEADFNKPIWSSYCNKPEKIETLANYLPPSMQKLIKKSMPAFESNTSVSIGVELLNIMELPSYGSGKRLNCPGSTTIKELIVFLQGKLSFDKHLIFSKDV